MGRAEVVAIVFAKAPVAGEVKTRLQPRMSAFDAARCYRAMAEDVVLGIHDSARVDPVLFFTPTDSEDEFHRWFPHIELVAQAGSDLGERMLGAFSWARDMGYSRTVILGTDLPTITHETVAAALHALDDSDVVLGPSADGGYYLVGAREPHPALFTGVAWSTPSVLDATLANARAADLTVHLLAQGRDIDTYEDIVHLKDSLADSACRAEAPRTARVLDELFGSRDGPSGRGSA